jgi:YVTN family beta-propeller protein
VSNMALDADTDTLYALVSDDSSSSLSVVDTTTDAVEATIALPSLPQAVSVDTTRGLVYVTSVDLSASTGSVSVFSTSTNALLATIQLGDFMPIGSNGSGAPAIDPATGSIYIPGASAGQVAGVTVITSAQIVTAEGNSPVTPTTIPLPDGFGPVTNVAVNSATGIVYATEYSATSSDGNGALVELSTASNSILSTIAVGPGPEALVVDPPTGTVYFSETVGSGSAIGFVDSGSSSVNGTIPLRAGADSLALDPTSGTLLAGIVQPFEGGTINELAVIDTGKHSVTQEIPMTYPADVVVDGAGKAFVSAANSGNTTISIVSPISVARVSGTDRYATSVQVAKTEFPSTASVVFVASGTNYPDALSAGPAAVKEGGPVLLTDPASLPAVVKSEIQSLNPSTIVVVGGPGSVSANVLSQLEKAEPTATVQRIFGADRYATSRAIVSTFTTASTVYIATGANFPDALTAGGAAGSGGDPLLLVNGSETSVDSATAALLTSLGATNIDIVGGPASISAGLASSLATFGTVTRLSGTDRYGTAEAVNEFAYSHASNVILATGLNFPDALSASTWAGATAAPMYLSETSCVPQKVLNDMQTLGATDVTLIGGTGALTQTVASLKHC